MSDDLRRGPGDLPETPTERAGRPQLLSDLYVDDRDDIFDTNDTNDTNDTSEDATDGGEAGDAEADRPFDFDPRRAGLAEVSAEEAARYIADNKAARPWLAPAADRHPQVQRVYAAVDQGQGHAIPRHDDFGDDTLYERRAGFQEDPAQLDDAKRAAGIDGTLPGDKKHYCAEYATRIHDADAFATAFARGVEHPRLRAVLDRYDPDHQPQRVLVPIADLLGPDGHEHCSGFRLTGDDMKAAKKDRAAWLAGGRREGLEEPNVEPIPTFQGGHIEFRFRHNRTRDGYELSTMFPQPPDEPADKEKNQ